MCECYRNVAQAHGFSIDTHKGRRVNIYADDGFDLIIALDKQNYRDLLTLSFESAKVKKLGDFGLNVAYILDSYTYKDVQSFEKIYEMIALCVCNLLAIYYPVLK